MTILVFGGAGFVGLNIVERLLREGASVRVFDQSPVPESALRVFAGLSGVLDVREGDVTCEDDVRRAINADVDTIVLGAAITAGSEQENGDPGGVLAVNLNAIVPILQAARDAKVKRVVNLSSVAAYGRWMYANQLLSEVTPCEPESLYGISKLGSEQVGRRLATLWGFEFVNLRLSAVFGPWERPTGARQRLSPQAQLLALCDAGEDALLSRPGFRDWIYSRDVAEAVARIVALPGSLPRDLYLLSSGQSWSALAWGQALAVRHPGWTCRLALPGEEANIDLGSERDRNQLDTMHLAVDLKWRAGFNLASSIADIETWREQVRALAV